MCTGLGHILHAASALDAYDPECLFIVFLQLNHLGQSTVVRNAIEGVSSSLTWPMYSGFAQALPQQ